MGEKQTPVDPAFGVLPKNKACFTIWRIENLKPVPLSKAHHGSFYTGDSYIIYSAKEARGALDMHIHFWLGAETSQDELGAAAIKTVELDDYMGGAPIQHREVQGSESNRFLSYFAKDAGVKYLSGGVASGFNHVDNTAKPRLFHIKGKTHMRITEVPIGWNNMNKGDVFILDLGEVVFVWFGNDCRRSERIKAMEYSRSIRDKRGKGNLFAVEDGEEGSMGDILPMFTEHLPLGEKNRMKSAKEAGDDEVQAKTAQQALKLWKVWEDSSQLNIEIIAEGKLNKKMLNSDDCFIVDNGASGIWVWVGKQASKRERRESMNHALSFVKQRSLPDNTNVTRVPETGEPPEFKVLFNHWETPKVPGNKTYSQGKIAKVVQTRFDANTMHDNPKMAAETKMVDDGSGKKTIYRVERTGNTYELNLLDKRYHGQLFGGDCYIIKYVYQVNGREHYILYYWLGQRSTQDEQTAMAYKVRELDDELGGAAVQIRVVQGKEPKHFMAIFQGKLVIFHGGKAGWGTGQDEGPGDTYLLHVRGNSSMETKAIQVDCRAESLNSNDCFVLITKNSVWIWFGKGSTGDEREMAKQVATISPRQPNIVMESQEKEDFWDKLGGKAEYSDAKRLLNDEEGRDPRLFQCSNASGNFSVEEIFDFAQVDLVPEDVFILDADDTVYIWIGAECTAEEKKRVVQVAQEYLQKDPSQRDSGTPIIQLKQGYEPPDFVGFFGAWDRELWSKGKSYNELKAEMEANNQNTEEIVTNQQGADVNSSFTECVKYPYAELSQAKDTLPSEIDLGNRERHLTEEEFLQVFGMSYPEFVGIPAWKQIQVKKAKNLF